MSDHHNSHDCNHHRASDNNNLSALMAGALIGAAAAYLFGTEKGKKLKEELIEEGQKLLEKIGTEVEKAQKEEIKGKIVGAINKAEDITNDIVENMTEVPKHIAEVQKKGRKFFFKRGQSSHHHVAES